ncbi:hypothetical protein Mapa_003678 [Marchantia paleacea]|nr:hypothetical protein Mapa_003678 [Marchantia paleacea]
MQLLRLAPRPSPPCTALPCLPTTRILVTTASNEHSSTHTARQPKREPGGRYNSMRKNPCLPLYLHRWLPACLPIQFRAHQLPRAAAALANPPHPALPSCLEASKLPLLPSVWLATLLRSTRLVRPADILLSSLVLPSNLGVSV